MAKRKRRAFTTEFKGAGGADRAGERQARGHGGAGARSDGDGAAQLGPEAEIDTGRGTTGALTTAEREELSRLRRENRTLQMERGILKKRRPSSRRTLEVELARDATWTTRTHAQQDVFDYLERFYNGQRRHSTLGYRSPIAFERQWTATEAATGTPAAAQPIGAGSPDEASL